MRSDEAKARLLPHVAQGNRAKAASAPVVAILAADTDFHEQLPRLLPHAKGAKEMFADDAVREQAARFNATLQAGYFILAARAAGPRRRPDGRLRRRGRRPGVPRRPPGTSLLLVNLGHAADGGTVPAQPRLDRDEVFRSV